MRSFVFNGTDFGALARAKVVGESALFVVAQTAGVPGRAGGAILSVDVPPKRVRLKLFLEPMGKQDGLAMAAIRRRLHAALLATDGAELQYEDNYVYRDALCTKADAWDTLFESGSCELEFTIYDPIAYSRVRRVEDAGTFDVGGTWQTWPTVELVADGSETITIANADAVTAVTLTGGFVAGSIVVVDYETETVTVDGLPASKRIALASTFSAIRPGRQRFAIFVLKELCKLYVGCSLPIRIAN